MANRLLFLMRHAEAVTFAPGLGDIDRPLSSDGRDQAGRAGTYLEELGVRIEGVLCSAAVRTKETAGLLGLSAPVRHTTEIYNAGSDTIRELVSEVDDSVTVLLVVGHAPGSPRWRMTWPTSRFLMRRRLPGSAGAIPRPPWWASNSKVPGRTCGPGGWRTASWPEPAGQGVAE